MSQKQSACIPPPSDYTPKGRNHRSDRSRDRGSRGGRGHRGGHQTCHTPSSSRRGESDDRKKDQPRDKFYKNDDDDYFGRVQSDEEGNDSTQTGETSRVTDPGDEEDDPLDAYMKSLEGGEKMTRALDNDPQEPDCRRDRVDTSTSIYGIDNPDKKGVRLDIDGGEDIVDSFYGYIHENKARSVSDSMDDPNEFDERQNLVEYDHDGNIISVRKTKRDIDPLPPIDHSAINYESFRKSFYQEHAEIEKLTPEQGDDLRSKLEIKVTGNNAPKPVCSFAHFKFDEQLMRVIRKSEYTQPTPIQAQAIPAALMGRNIIGVAMTGSGKTAAYLWPMIVHIMGQPNLKHGDGPIGLVLVPTRELALQVYGEAKKFSSSYKIMTVCAYGGGSKYEQSRDLEAGAEIVVATPGRLIDLIKMGATNLRRLTYLVLDEADRFFEMGFEAQVRSICDHIRPDRQTLLFSATFKKKIEQLARTVTEDPIKIVQRGLGEANEDVTQHVIILPDSSKKWSWLLNRIIEFRSAGSVLIFVTRIVNSEELHKNLEEAGQTALLLHGDMEQSERNRVITAFKRREKDIMIATDVAARGLDIAHIRTVINYDVARDIDTHVHRVGRTGRAGSKGDAYTLMTDRDRDFAGHLVKNFEASNQRVDDGLMKLAMQSHSFRKSRYSSSKSHHRRSGQHEQRSDSGQHGSRHQPHHHAQNRYTGDSQNRESRSHSTKPREKTDGRLSAGHNSSSRNHSASPSTSASCPWDNSRKRHRWN